MIPAATLTALSERLAAAKGPDREIDAAIIAALIAPAGAFARQSPFNGAWCIYTGEKDRSGRDRLWEGSRPWDNEQTRNVTASLDVAVALVERICPAKRLEIGIYPTGSVATLRWYPEGIRGEPSVDAVGESKTTPALALCTALVAALLAQQATTSERGSL